MLGRKTCLKEARGEKTVSSWVRMALKQVGCQSNRGEKADRGREGKKRIKYHSREEEGGWGRKKHFWKAKEVLRDTFLVQSRESWGKKSDGDKWGFVSEVGRGGGAFLLNGG